MANQYLPFYSRWTLANAVVSIVSFIIIIIIAWGKPDFFWLATFDLNMSATNQCVGVKEQREQNDLVKTFRDLLHSGKYYDADLFLKTKLNGQLNDLRERARYCSAGYSHMQQLCSGGSLVEARDLATKFDYLGFDVFYDYFTGALDNAHRKLNKSTER